MLILAIDTALDACAAAVLDTESGRLIAQESLAMKRGHAEALMPLIARVIKASGVGFAGLDRIAVTTGPAALQDYGSASPPHAALRWPPASLSSGSRRCRPMPLPSSARTANNPSFPRSMRGTIMCIFRP